jgi:hypothetical protein
MRASISDMVGGRVMKILLVYFSNTGHVMRVAEMLRAELEPRHEVTLAAIMPRKPHSYWFWLALSFVPGCRVPICEMLRDVRDFDLVFLGMPKWTLSCPPINQYLHRLRGHCGKPFAVWLCYGGFDQDRFLRSFLRKLKRMGVLPVASRLFKRGVVGEGNCQTDLADFCRVALSAVRVV